MADTHLTNPLDAADAVPADFAREAAAVIADRTGVARHDIALTLGSGWGKAADAIGETVALLDAAEVPGFSKPALDGHSGTLRSIRLASGAHALVIGARTHYYEGHGVRRVVHSVRTAAAAGARVMVLTNGCGGLRPEWAPGTPVLIRDHINLTADSPLEGATFVDLTDVYTPRLRAPRCRASSRSTRASTCSSAARTTRPRPRCGTQASSAATSSACRRRSRRSPRDAATRDDLQALLDRLGPLPEADEHIAEDDASDRAAAWRELRDRFATRLSFGTAGLRGRQEAGPNRMNRVVVAQAARGLADYLLAKAGGARPSIVIGYDARRNSDVFARDTAEIMQGAGVDAMLLPRELPTPVLAFAVRRLDADAGVMVTASHNPPQDNGYKVYLGGADGGSQIVAPADAEIAAAITEVANRGGRVGELPRSTDYRIADEAVVDEYVDRTAEVLRGPIAPLRVVYTPLHGVGWETFARVLERAGAPLPEVVAEQVEPDGDFPTVDFPNPEEEGALDLAYAKADAVGAELIIAHDPDADRLAVAVPAPGGGWHRFGGNDIGKLLGWRAARAAHERGDTAGSTLATSLVSSPAMSKVAERYGLGYAETQTGFKWISRAEGIVYGYEEALGYLVNPETLRDKDGISAAMAILELAMAQAARGRTPRPRRRVRRGVRRLRVAPGVGALRGGVATAAGDGAAAGAAAGARRRGRGGALPRSRRRRAAGEHPPARARRRHPHHGAPERHRAEDQVVHRRDLGRGRARRAPPRGRRARRCRGRRDARGARLSPARARPGARREPVMPAAGASSRRGERRLAPRRRRLAHGGQLLRPRRARSRRRRRARSRLGMRRAASRSHMRTHTFAPAPTAGPAHEPPREPAMTDQARTHAQPAASDSPVAFGLHTFGDVTADEHGAPLSSAQTIRNIVDEAVLADELGIDAFGVGEHHRDDFALSSPEIALAAIAGRTERILLGTGVTVLSSDDPVRVYERFATLDALSNGRAEAIMGRGSFTESFPLFGFDLRDYETLFDEKHDLWLRLLREESVTWKGTTRAPLTDVTVYPRLESGTMRTWRAVGGSPQSVIDAARKRVPLMLAIIGGAPQRFAPYAALYREALEKSGADAPLPVGMHSPGHIADTDEAAMAQLWPHFKASHDRIGAERGWGPATKGQFRSEIEYGSLYVGSPETVARRIADAIRALGVVRFDLKYANGRLPHELMMRSIELYGTQVVPRVQELLAERPA